MDITTRVLALQDAKMRMELARKQIRMEVEHEYKQRAQKIIEDRVKDAELEFAHEIKRANDEGVPQAVIRKDVLRTNAWDRWTYWRDLAEIEPDRIRVQNRAAEKQKQSGDYYWEQEDSGWVLYWRVNWEGAEMAEPVRFDKFHKSIRGHWDVDIPDERLWELKRAGFEFAAPINRQIQEVVAQAREDGKI